MKYYQPDFTFKIKSINSNFTRDYKDGGFFSGELHDFWEMVYVVSGRITVSEDEKVYDLCAGQAIFHAPMEFHRFWVKKSEPAKFRIISFDLETDIKHNLSKGVFSFNVDLKEQFDSVYTQVHNSFIADVTVPKENVGIEEEALAIKKLEVFLLSVICESSPDRTQQISVGAQRYKEVVYYMKENLYNTLTAEQIAEKTNLSISYLKKLFRIYAGCGIMHYYTRLKITRAISHLKEGMSINEISDLLCFSSPNYFSSVFKRETGMMPSKYRNRKQQGI